MKNAIDAINELIKSANLAQSRGAYSLKEAHEAYLAIEFLNTAVAAQQQANQATQTETPKIEKSDK